MTEPIFSLQYDDSQVQNRLQRLLQKTGDLSPAMKEIGEVLILSTDERFEQQISPAGTPWQPLSPRTLSQKAAQGRIQRILQNTGLMRSRVNYRAERDQCVVGNSASYAGFIQQGTARMPARPFLGVSKEDKREVVAIIENHLIN